MPTLEECGNWAVYPAFVKIRSDQNRWGCCLADDRRETHQKRGNVPFLNMLQGLDKCWECEDRAARSGEDPPTALENPICGCYRDWKQDDRGRQIGTCAPTGRRRVKFMDMIEGTGSCEGCSKRTVWSDENTTTFQRGPRRFPEEGIQMIQVDMSQFDKEFRRQMKKIGEDKALQTAQGAGGLPSKYNCMPATTVEQFLQEHAEALIESVRHPHEGEGGNDLGDVAEAFRLNSSHLQQYLRVVTNQKKAERLKNVLFDLGDPEGFFEKLDDDPQGLDLGEGSSVWAVMAQTMRALFDGQFPKMTIHAIAERLEVSDGLIAYLGLRYLEKAEEVTVGSRPAGLPTAIVEALDAIPTMMQMKRVVIFADRAILPEELLDNGDAFLRDMVSNYPGLVELVTGLVDLKQETSVYHCLAVMKGLGSKPEDLCPVIVKCTGTTLRQARKIWDDIEEMDPAEDDDDEDEGTGKGGRGADDPLGDQDERLRILVRGHEYGKRGAFQIPARHILCDREPLFAPLNETENCSEWAIRMLCGGIPPRAAAVLLNKSDHAFDQFRSDHKENIVVDEALAAKYAYLDELARFVRDGTIRNVGDGPNKDLDPDHPISVSGLTHGQMLDFVRTRGRRQSPPSQLPTTDDVLSSCIHDPANAKMLAELGLNGVVFVPTADTVRNGLSRLKGVLEEERVDQVILEIAKLGIIPKAEIRDVWAALPAREPIFPHTDQLTPDQVGAIWNARVGELPGLRRHTNTRAMPEVPDDMTLLAYGQLLVDQLTPDVVFSVLAGSPLSKQQIAEKLVIELPAAPAPPPPPPPPPVPTVATAIKPPPITSVQRGTVIGFGKFKAEVMSLALAELGQTIIGFQQRCEKIELELLRKKQEEGSVKEPSNQDG